MSEKVMQELLKFGVLVGVCSTVGSLIYLVAFK